MAQPAKMPKNRQVLTLLNSADYDALDALVTEDGMNMSEWVRDLIRTEIRRRGPVKRIELPGQLSLLEEES